jgi:hypothetical protein
LTSPKRSGLRRKGFDRIPDSDEEVVLPPGGGTVVQEVVAQEVEGQEAVVPEAVVREVPDPEAAAVAPKAAAPEKGRAVAAETEVVEAGPNANIYLIPKGVP